MESILVVVDSTAPNKTLLTESKRHATGTDSKILLCCIRKAGFRQSGVQRHSKAGREASEIDQHAAETTANEIATETFGSDIDHDVIGIVEDNTDEILRLATEHDCDHIFITTGSRTAVGKAVFGDVAQKVVLGFDGPVTVVGDA